MKPDKKEKKLVLRQLLLPLSIMLVGLVLIIAVSWWQHNNEIINKQIIDSKSNIERTLEHELQIKAKNMGLLLDTITNDINVQQQLLEGDSEQILASWTERFEIWRRDYGITNLVFADANRFAITFVHTPEKPRIVLQHNSALEAERTGKMAWDIGVCPSSGYTILRAWQPVFVKGRVIGYVGAGKSIESILTSLPLQSSSKIMLTVKKEYVEQGAWENAMALRGEEIDWDTSKHNAILYTTVKPLSEDLLSMAEQLDKEAKGKILEIDSEEKIWRIYRIKFSAGSIKDFGNIVITSDITTEKLAVSRKIMVGIVAFIVLIAILLGTVYDLLRRTDETIMNNKKELFEKKEQYENLFYKSPLGIFQYDKNGTIVKCNNKFAEIIGSSQEVLLGFNVFHDMKNEKVIKAVEVSLRAGEGYYEGDYISVTAGKTATVRILCEALRDETEQIYAGIGLVEDISKRKQMEVDLKDKLNQIELINENIPNIIWKADINKNDSFENTYISDVANDFLALPAKTLNNDWSKYFSYIKDNYLPDVFAAFQKGILNPEEKISCEYEVEKADGTIAWLYSVGKVIKNENGKSQVYGTTTDITERKQMEALLYLEKEQFKTTLLSVGDGVISTDKQGNVVIMNQIAEELTGWSQKEAYGRPLNNVLQIIHEYTREICEDPAQKVLESGEIIELANHTMLIAKNGKEIPIEDSAAPIKDHEGKITGVVLVFRDFTEKKEKQKQIEYISYHDHLTGLYNRRYTESMIKKLDIESNLPFTIMILDVNGLKLTNDAFGHEMGDRLLKRVAQILKKACRATDIIGRIGGDEFAVLLPKTEKVITEKIKKRIIKAASEAKLESVIVSLAVGYAVKERKEQEIEEILTKAENDMYKNKLKSSRIMRNQTIENVVRNINVKYDQEQIHTERVSKYCEAIARAMELSEKEIMDIKTAGVLHDLGKIMVPVEILNKSTKLTEEEFEVIKRHPETGYQILKSVDEYAALAEAVLYHHEHWDGNGYPEGLKRQEIPFISRIIAVADAYEAMTAKRAYHKTKNKEEAVAELKRCAGTQFDPEIVKLFVEKVL